MAPVVYGMSVNAKKKNPEEAEPEQAGEKVVGRLSCSKKSDGFFLLLRRVVGGNLDACMQCTNRDPAEVVL